uniref:Uncharacterized protein n=1 Tax=Spongospora subterranea TaxID=70186 RepID=A0A0H5QSU7_9EUKA|eukprot:CRZ05093.1 hypothetical protein [Spongospora subterranea]
MLTQHSQWVTRSAPLLNALSQKQQGQSGSSPFQRLRTNAISMQNKLSEARRNISVKEEDLAKQKRSNAVVKDKIQDCKRDLTKLNSEVRRCEQLLEEFSGKTREATSLLAEAAGSFKANDLRLENCYHALSLGKKNVEGTRRRIQVLNHMEQKRKTSVEEDEKRYRFALDLLNINRQLLHELDLTRESISSLGKEATAVRNERHARLKCFSAMPGLQNNVERVHLELSRLQSAMSLRSLVISSIDNRIHFVKVTSEQAVSDINGLSDRYLSKECVSSKASKALSEADMCNATIQEVNDEVHKLCSEEATVRESESAIRNQILHLSRKKCEVTDRAILLQHNLVAKTEKLNLDDIALCHKQVQFSKQTVTYGDTKAKCLETKNSLKQKSSENRSKLVFLNDSLKRLLNIAETALLPIGCHNVELQQLEDNLQDLVRLISDLNSQHCEWSYTLFQTRTKLESLKINSLDNFELVQKSFSDKICLVMDYRKKLRRFESMKDRLISLSEDKVSLDERYNDLSMLARSDMEFLDTLDNKVNELRRKLQEGSKKREYMQKEQENQILGIMSKHQENLKSYTIQNMTRNFGEELYRLKEDHQSQMRNKITELQLLQTIANKQGPDLTKDSKAKMRTPTITQSRNKGHGECDWSINKSGAGTSHKPRKASSHKQNCSDEKSLTTSGIPQTFTAGSRAAARKTKKKTLLKQVNALLSDAFCWKWQTQH